MQSQIMYMPVLRVVSKQFRETD